MSTLNFRESLDPRRFFQGEKPRVGAITLSHRRIFIIPNKRGLGLGLLLLVQLLASINYNNSLGFILTFLVGSIAMLGSVYGFRNLSGLIVRSSRAEPVFVGDVARFKITVENTSQTPHISLHVGFRGGVMQTFNLRASDIQQISLNQEATQRGWLPIPTVTITSAFPLGIFRAWSPLRLAERVLVYPRPAPDSMPFPSAPNDGGAQQANADDFRGFQSYQPGDPLRRIYWKGVAKGQGVHVKEYRGEDSIQLYLDWQQTPGRDVEARLSRLCRWVLDAEQMGAAYGLRLPSMEIKPASGPLHLRICLERLALFGL